MFLILVSMGLSFLFLLINKARYGSLAAPYVCFNVVWFVVSAMLLLGNPRIYTPSTQALTCVFLGIVFFNLSALAPKLTVGKKRLLIRGGDRELNVKRIKIVAAFTVAACFLLSLESIESFLTGATAADVRTEYYANSSGTLVYYLRSYIIAPLRYAVIVSALIAFFTKHNSRGFLLACAGILVLLQSITSGGRYIAMNTLFMLLCTMWMFGTSRRLSPKQKTCIALIFAFAFAIIVYLTNDRATYVMESMGVLERLYTTFYNYFAGSVTYMGAVCEQFPEIVGTTFGINSIAGFITPFFALLSFLGVLPYPRVLNVIGTYACSILPIGPGMYYNAMPTIFGYFFIDGGFLGVCIESFLFGYVCKMTFLEARSQNLLFCAFYALLFMQICDSSTRWFFFTPEFALAFLYLPFFFRPIANKKETL